MWERGDEGGRGAGLVGFFTELALPIGVLKVNNNFQRITDTVLCAFGPIKRN